MELSSSDVSDADNSIPPKPSGRGSFNRRGNTKFFLDCYGMDIAPMNIFENQVVPVGSHNLSKSFRPNLNTIRVLSLGTKFIPKWTFNTFKRFNEFKTKRIQNFFSKNQNLVFLRKTKLLS